MATLTDRIRAGWQAFARVTPSPQPSFAELALADPRRLFPGGYSTPYNPSDLVGTKGLRIFDQMRRDDQIKAAVSFKKGSVLSTGWTVTSPEGVPEDWEVTRFVDNALRALTGALEDDLWEVLSAIEYGFSVTEKLWAVASRGAFAGKIVLRELKTRRPHDFNFVQDEFGNLRPDGITQAQRGLAPVPLPADKFVVFTYDEEFSNKYGRSDLEAAYRHWWAKDNALKWLVMLLERLGIPPVFGLYDPNRYTNAQLDDLKSIFQNLQAATFGMIPRPSSATKDAPSALDFWTPELAGQATRVFIPALELYDKSIARALLMPGHLGLTADQAEGSYARAKVAFDVFVLIIEKIRRDLETRVMQEQIIKPLVDWNYTVEAYPQWKFLPLTDDVRLDILDRWAGLVGAGVVQRQAEDETHIRALLQFPERSAIDLRGPGADILTFAQAKYDRKVQYARIERSLDRLEADVLTALREGLMGVRDRLLSVVSNQFPETASDVNDLDLRGLGVVQDLLREFMRSAYGLGEETVRDELPKQFQLAPGGIFTPTEALRWLSGKALSVFGVLRHRLLDEAKQVLLNALKFGEVQSETIRKLRAIFEPYVGDPTAITDDKILEPYRLEAILRTNATEAFNQGRLTAVMDPKIKPFIRGMVYSAVLDDRTTPVCRYLDGKIFPLDEPDLARLAPPNHHNCRSLLVPVTLDMTIDTADLITPAQLGRAEELAQKGFK